MTSSANQLPYLIERFLTDTDWRTPRTPEITARMQRALEFFSQHGLATLPLDAIDAGYRSYGFNPFHLKSSTAGDRPTTITAAMQAIDFRFEVEPVNLEAETSLSAYRHKTFKRGSDPAGRWYTDPGTKASSLALPPDQSARHGYEVRSETPALKSIAGDLLVDWNMPPDLGRKPTVGLDYHYRRGGGVQYFVPYAKRDLRPL